MEIASVAEMDGVVEGTLAISRESQQIIRWKSIHDAQGLTNEDPKETTLLALLNATFATAFAIGMSFCETVGKTTLRRWQGSMTHNLLVDVCVLNDMV